MNEDIFKYILYSDVKGTLKSAQASLRLEIFKCGALSDDKLLSSIPLSRSYAFFMWELLFCKTQNANSVSAMSKSIPPDPQAACNRFVGTNRSPIK